ncbi:TonB-dependent receptor [Cryomorpha ignava]|uniref:TonB-dependent receptor n=1 Tax=Cryomorpha ignava TaxID=101383 RepID=A0A7K3WJV9_9FLAO|nr:TonB-dependent receptor [Cryomorpha ignava]NEN21933.1 TonB-dependent receptor [Cryomorpha ignava]
MKSLILLTLIIIFSFSIGCAQIGNIRGSVNDIDGKPLPFAAVQVKNTNLGTAASESGSFTIHNVPVGAQTIEITTLGFQRYSTSVDVKAGETVEINAKLKEGMLDIEEIVVTGTRTAKRQTDSPVIVNLIDSKDLDQVVATNLSEGLRFQPGLRVETDCQTCSYTQIRMNGLQGGYSQILINGRPTFSPLTGLYGLEQIPVNMIERIETVRGGVSALYGSSAIGGTVNVITKVPNDNGYSVSNTFQSIRGKTNDNILAGNATLVNEAQNAGATFFVSNRNRKAFDANGDNFSELPQLKNNSFGANLFFLPAKNQKLEISLSSINEYRYGGEMVKGAAHLAKQSEERTHNVFMGSLDYQINFNEDNNSLIAYYGAQRTDRQHYTGIVPDDDEQLKVFLADPPYGASDVITHQGGLQFDNKFKQFLGGSAVLTIGGEYLYDSVYDEIDAYNYLIDQTTTDLGIFVQNDWDVTKKLNFLAGFRLDKHNLVDNMVFSPRLSLLYKLDKNMQFRLGWGTGFRAPQAFDADLHIAFAGGGVSRITLADNLKEERSNSFTGSVNYDRATEHYIFGFTVEGFYTTLDDAFYQFPLGEDDFGERFEKRNGSGATVQGITLEARANFDYVVNIEAGFTIQTSLFNDPVENMEGLPAKREFLRTPNTYGYATLTYNISRITNVSANFLYTGKMDILHLGGEDTGHRDDAYYTSSPFTEVGLRAGHTFALKKGQTGLEIFAGAKNIFDAYQNDFDIGKNRDSNYIYGPSLPRTFLVGVKLKSL